MAPRPGVHPRAHYCTVNVTVALTGGVTEMWLAPVRTTVTRCWPACMAGQVAAVGAVLGVAVGVAGTGAQAATSRPAPARPAAKGGVAWTSAASASPWVGSPGPGRLGSVGTIQASRRTVPTILLLPVVAL